MTVEIIVYLLPSPIWLFVWYLIGAFIAYHISFFTCKEENLFFSPLFVATVWPIALMGICVSTVLKPLVFVFEKYETFLLSIKNKRSIERR